MNVELDVRPDFFIRRADPAEIDVLGAIDDDAAALFREAGLDLDFPPRHAFVLHERCRWEACLAAGTVLLAVDRASGPVGFAMLGRLDGEAYLEQISVRAEATRRGIGTWLLGAVSVLAKAADERSIVLTTYGHLPWNRPFYERNGYAAVHETACGHQLARELEIQRRWLPRPEQRIAMRRSLA